MEMNYFADRVCKAVSKELGKDYEVKVQQVWKNNGICRTGLLVLEKDGETRRIRMAHGRWRFVYQLEHFADCIFSGRKESWVIPFEESCEIIETMERTLEAGGLVYPEYLTKA